jgi:hypothetical protein
MRRLRSEIGSLALTLAILAVASAAPLRVGNSLSTDKMVSPGAGPIFNIVFPVGDRRLNVGDSGSGEIDNSGTFFTVIDCSTVPDVP